jgi:hypothetical protein
MLRARIFIQGVGMLRFWGFIFVVCFSVYFFVKDNFRYKTPESNFNILTIKTSSPKTLTRELRSGNVEVLGFDLENGTVDIISDRKDIFANVVGVKKFPLDKPDSRYLNYGSLLPAIETLASAHPELVSYFSIGKSIEGRDILALKISDRSSSKNKTAVFFNGMHHAREVMTTEVVMSIAKELADNYQSDLKYKKWLESVDVYLVPMVNPDGNYRVWNGQTMWRKNAKGGYGVDLNRNYPYRWSECNGSSGSRYSDTFRGDSPGSEAETQAIMHFVKTIKPKFSISYHSYSEIVIYPYSCQGEHLPGVDGDRVKEIGTQLAKLHSRDSGNGTYEAGTSWELLYPVDGGDIDWMYSEIGTLPFVVELNSAANGFQPDFSKVAPTIEKVKSGWQYILSLAANN